MQENWQAELETITRNVKYNESLSRHTSFRIGGPAAALVEAHSVDELKAIIALREWFSLPVMVIGCGTNILFSDAGYKGIIIVLSTEFSQVRYENCENGERKTENGKRRTENGGQRTENGLPTSDFRLPSSEFRIPVIAGAGVALNRLAQQCARLGLSGLEFAYGIPGALGGALIMNAGAYGCSMSEIVTDIKVMTHSGVVLTISRKQAEFTYRQSALNQYFCVLAATLQLIQAPHDQIIAKMQQLYAERKSKLPLNKPSAGCVFKNPPAISAGKLIDECALKGTRVGGAEVSKKHANFIINTGGATAKDVLELIDEVRNRVYSQIGVTLEQEIHYISGMWNAE